MTKNIDEQLPFNNWIFVCHRKHPPQPHSHFLFLIYLFLIGGELLYNIVLVSTIHQRESARVIMCPLSLEPPSHFPPIPPLEVVSEHQLWVPCVTQQIPTGSLILRMAMYMSQCCSLNLSHPLLPPVYLQVSSLMSASPLPLVSLLFFFFFSLESLLMRWMNLEPITQSEVNQKEKTN